MIKMNNLKQVVLTLMLLFMLSSAVLSEKAKPASKAAPENKELINNGSFEEAEEHRNARDLIRKKFDVETAEDAWAFGWWVNPGVGVGKVRIVTGKGAPDGKRYLHINSKQNIHIAANKSTNDASKTYTYHFKAKGSGRMRLCAYLYGIKAGRKGVNNSLGYPTFREIAPTDQWKAYNGTLKVKNSDARHFLLLLVVRGNISVDQISLKVVPEIKQADK